MRARALLTFATLALTLLTFGCDSLCLAVGCGGFGIRLHGGELDGEFEFAPLPDGDYLFLVDADGVRTWWRCPVVDGDDTACVIDSGAGDIGFFDYTHDPLTLQILSLREEDGVNVLGGPARVHLLVERDGVEVADEVLEPVYETISLGDPKHCGRCESAVASLEL